RNDAPRCQSRSAKSLLRDLGLQETTFRYCSLPFPMPRALLSEIEGLAETDQTSLFRKLLRLQGTPLSKIHVATIAGHLGKRNKAFDLLALRICRKIVNRSGV